VSPAVAAGVKQILWSMEDIVNMIDAAQPHRATRGPCKKREAQFGRLEVNETKGCF
jgi:hypothetical protein